jgi:hypothetical protein
MSRIIVPLATLGFLAGTIVISSNFVRVKPEHAATLTQAQAKEGLPIVSPFDIMIKHGKTVAVEEWRDAF